MFKELLKKYLKLKGINQLELANITGDTQQSISEFLNNKSNPQKKTKEKFFSKLEGFKDFYDNIESENKENLDNKYIDKITLKIIENEDLFLKNKNFSNWLELKLVKREIKVHEAYAKRDKENSKKRD